jgi:hypothetical protein
MDRLAELEEQVNTLTQLVVELKARLSSLENEAVMKPADDAPRSRRDLLKLGGFAALGAVGAVAMRAVPTSAANVFSPAYQMVQQAIVADSMTLNGNAPVLIVTQDPDASSAHGLINLGSNFAQYDGSSGGNGIAMSFGAQFGGDPINVYVGGNQVFYISPNGQTWFGSDIFNGSGTIKLGYTAGGAPTGAQTAQVLGPVPFGHKFASNIQLPYRDGNVYLDSAMGFVVRTNGDVSLTQYFDIDSNGIATFRSPINPVRFLGGLTVKAGGAAITGDVTLTRGASFWGHAAVVAQPAAPTTLADVIAIIRGYGLSA